MDIGFYHRMKELSKGLLEYFEFLEMSEWKKCDFYHFGINACESWCSCPDIKRTVDFQPEKECWKCKHRKVRRKP